MGTRTVGTTSRKTGGIFVPILQGGEKHKKQNLRRICREIQTEENDRRLLYTIGDIRSYKGLGVQTLQY